ncbi:ATP-binding protein [Sulfidibacter corallicola]|uniref:ATP-binding protein n=1 Tax=Sulfidibacter corallicola TaxID=2818388 RepID=A0A8A4TDG8_SULCO|nr:ATP-binding protein [Sulfidibacter corallicola]QTD47610.1 ATP-binding protein [Sulfidibacter corallicola]
MSSQLQLQIENKFESIRELADPVERFARDHGLDEQGTMSLNLAIVEWVSNIIKYSFDDHGGHVIDVRLSQDDTKVKVDIFDTGKPFDPLQAPPPDLDSDIESRPVGGLGIYIIKTVADALQYRRESGRNHLKMWFSKSRQADRQAVDEAGTA